MNETELVQQLVRDEQMVKRYKYRLLTLLRSYNFSSMTVTLKQHESLLEKFSPSNKRSIVTQASRFWA